MKKNIMNLWPNNNSNPRQPAHGQNQPISSIFESFSKKNTENIPQTVPTNKR